MALSYNYEKCDDSNWTKDDHNIARNFCWTLMAVGMQDVTEKNKNEPRFNDFKNVIADKAMQWS